MCPSFRPARAWPTATIWPTADRKPSPQAAFCPLAFIDGLKLWNGAAFADAGITELKGFRGSNPAITTPAANFAVTSDSGPFDSVSLAAIAANYGAEGAEGTVR